MAVFVVKFSFFVVDTVLYTLIVKNVELHTKNSEHILHNPHISSLTKIYPSLYELNNQRFSSREKLKINIPETCNYPPYVEQFLSQLVYTYVHISCRAKCCLNFHMVKKIITYQKIIFFWI
jgi:hypothetical protein